MKRKKATRIGELVQSRVHVDVGFAKRNNDPHCTESPTHAYCFDYRAAVKGPEARASGNLFTFILTKSDAGTCAVPALVQRYLALLHRLAFF